MLLLVLLQEVEQRNANHAARASRGLRRRGAAATAGARDTQPLHEITERTGVRLLLSAQQQRRAARPDGRLAREVFDTARELEDS